VGAIWSGLGSKLNHRSDFILPKQVFFKLAVNLGLFLRSQGIFRDLLWLNLVGLWDLAFWVLIENFSSALYIYFSYQIS
jgi:hypothetical protein